MHFFEQLGTLINLIVSLSLVAAFSALLYYVRRPATPKSERLFLKLDFGYAFIVAAAIAVTQSYLANKIGFASAWILLLPAIYLVFDLAENATALSDPDLKGKPILTTLKFFFVRVCVACVLAELLVWIYRLVAL